ncbi:ATP synthase F0 subunit C [Isosphaeraceae bacterium EP7]
MKLVKTAALAIVSLALMQAQVMAQATAGTAAVVAYPFSDLRALAVGLVIIGAAAGIGGLTKAAVESMARQPETASNIQTAMIISAALIEGVTFFALIIIGFILAG